jgi:hypothetical protein
VYCGRAVTPAIAILERAIARENGNQAAVARKIGVSRQRLSDAIQARGGYPLGIKACLQLAVEYPQEDALDVLRANGKAEIADLLEHLGFRSRRRRALDAAEQVAADIRALPPSDRKILELLTDRLAARKRRARRS